MDFVDNFGSAINYNYYPERKIHHLLGYKINWGLIHFFERHIQVIDTIERKIIVVMAVGTSGAFTISTTATTFAAATTITTTATATTITIATTMTTIAITTVTIVVTITTTAIRIATNRAITTVATTTTVAIATGAITDNLKELLPIPRIVRYIFRNVKAI